MSTVATNEKVTMQDGQLKEYNFRVCFLDPQQGKIAGSFVYDNLGFDKAAILYDVNDDYALGLKDNFVKVFESKGGTIVAEEGYTAATSRLHRAADQDQGSAAPDHLHPHLLSGFHHDPQAGPHPRH